MSGTQYPVLSDCFLDKEEQGLNKPDCFANAITWGILAGRVTRGATERWDFQAPG
jgi:hypothetical protein